MTVHALAASSYSVLLPFVHAHTHEQANSLDKESRRRYASEDNSPGREMCDVRASGGNKLKHGPRAEEEAEGAAAG